MDVTASDFYSYYRPSLCNLRVYLRQAGEPEAMPSPYEEVLRRLAERYEKAHLVTFPEVVDLSSVAWDKRLQATIEAIARGAPVVYQGGLKDAVTLDTVLCEIVREPDFLIAADGGYVVRDSKIAKRINEKHHPEIIYQLQLYGWLYERTFGEPPRRLEVHSGPSEIVEVPYDGGESALEVLKTILDFKRARAEFYSPVGWTKCNGCGFFDRC